MTITPPGLSFSALARQAELLRKRLPADPDHSGDCRRQITLTIAAGYERLVARLAPELVLEIGAHEGAFSRRVKAVLPGSTVIAAEANPAVYEKHHAALTEAGVVHVNRCISNSSGKLEFRVPLKKGKAANSMGSIFLDSRNKNFRTYSVEAMPLDKLAGSHAGKTNAIWIDVEGAMNEVLDGGSRTLSHCLALYCEMESETRWSGQSLDHALNERLSSFGLVPALRDIQRDWQYNAIYIRNDPDLLGEARGVIDETFARAVSGA